MAVYLSFKCDARQLMLQADLEKLCCCQAGAGASQPCPGICFSSPAGDMRGPVQWRKCPAPDLAGHSRMCDLQAAAVQKSAAKAKTDPKHQVMMDKITFFVGVINLV